MQLLTVMNTSFTAPTGGKAGYSLAEVVVVLSVAAIAATLSFPSMRSFSRSVEPGAAAREMVLSMRAARWKALLSGCRTRLATYRRKDDPALHYVIEREDGRVWIPEGGGHRIPDGITLHTTGPATKIFNPNGTSSMGSVIFEGPGGASYRLSLNPATGRVRLYRGGVEVGHGG